MITLEDAEKICIIASHNNVESLKRLWPEFNWRIYLDRNGERTRWAITIKDYEPREHYFSAYLQGKCIECNLIEPDPKKWRRRDDD